jgi:Icc-related predicted phosphoesterase
VRYTAVRQPQAEQELDARRDAGIRGLGDNGFMVRIAAIGDLHIRARAPIELANDLVGLEERADVLVVAGDITNGGRLIQAELAAEIFDRLPLPIVAVLGNHDRRCLRRGSFRRILERAGVILLEGETTVVDLGIRVGFAGVSGSGGGFWPVEGPDLLANRALQALAVRARREAARLDAALSQLDADVRVVVTHLAPTATTLGREPLVKYFLLGSSELGRVIDQHEVDLVIHGHAHLGNAVGQTTRGIPVRNVARDVTGGPIVHELPIGMSPRWLPECAYGLQS